jgi:carbon monoxide dehydrogenase subunit G
MKVEQKFEIAHPREFVWDRMCDVRLVTECLPGASIVEQLGSDRFRGRFTVKMGPIVASFDGEVAIERDPPEWTATVSGKGVDARSSSRASGSMIYRLDGSKDASTIVGVIVEFTLAGAVAQFGKGAIIQEIANRITAEFVRNFERRLSIMSDGEQVTVSVAASGIAAGGLRRNFPTHDAHSPKVESAKALDAGNLLWLVLKDRVVSFFKRIAGFR